MPYNDLLVERRSDNRAYNVKNKASTSIKKSRPKLAIAFLELYCIESNWSFKAVALASLEVLKTEFKTVSTEKN